MKWSPSKLHTQNQIDRIFTSKSIVDEEDILKYFMAFDIAPCGFVFTVVVGSQIVVP